MRATFHYVTRDARQRVSDTERFFCERRESQR